MVVNPRVSVIPMRVLTVAICECRGKVLHCAARHVNDSYDVHERLVFGSAIPIDITAREHFLIFVFNYFKMSAARIASLRERLVVGKLENRVLGHAINAQVRQQRVKLLPLHIAHVVWVIYALATAPDIIIAKYLKSANVRGKSEEELMSLAEESFLRADLQQILDICDEHASTDRFVWFVFPISAVCSCSGWRCGAGNGGSRNMSFTFGVKQEI